MFGVDWNDPQTLWLNLTNLALGLVTVAAVVVLAVAVSRELLGRRRRAHAPDALDVELNALWNDQSPHVLNVPGLGVTMADGGEPVDRKAGNQRSVE